MIYALDSNIVSYFIKKDVQIQKEMLLKIKQGDQFIIPPTVYFEVKRWLMEKNAITQMQEFSNLCKEMDIGEINISVLDKACDIYVSMRKKGNPIDDADIMIAAYCIVNDYALVTNNTRHFEAIDELQHVNWKA